ncbi:hypothetical protein [Rhizobium sp. Leaf311]|uniref:hypothetical protein n=1 Tax=Rhizobium sp. Leaf311 TaxID=1736332 RepID=UPI000A992A58|nr:hypothetical protein [Rhizobium sp. Leaf311]
MKRTILFLIALMGFSACSQAEEPPKLNLNVAIQSGTAMVCQFDHKVTETKKKKTEEQVEYFALISGKSAQLCDGEGKRDRQAMSCKRYEFVGKNEGGSIIYVSDDGYKLTTNVMALALGAGVVIDDLKMRGSKAYTGPCRSGEITAIKKGLPGYEE